MQLLNLAIAIVDSHRLPLQRPTATVPSSLPQSLLREWDVTPGRRSMAGRVSLQRAARLGEAPATWSRGEACDRAGESRWRGSWRGSRHEGVGKWEPVRRPALAGGEVDGRGTVPQESPAAGGERAWPAGQRSWEEGAVEWGRFGRGGLGFCFRRDNAKPDRPFPILDVRSRIRVVARAIARRLLLHH
jgi:hypothetical protein